jgi:hypothetical protein
MENTTYELGPLLAEIRDGSAACARSAPPSEPPSARTGARRAARTSLERDLASYTSPGDLNDLDAILDRHSEEDTAGIRRILAARRAA